MFDQFVGTKPVEDRHRIDETALDAWMRAQVEGYKGPLVIEQFKGGQSNPTYRIDTPGRSYVLRRQPFGKLLPSAHAVDREYKAMHALGPTGFPVPKTYGLCEDPEVLGSKFFVMGLADGRSLWNGSLPGVDPSARREIYNAMIDTMADLHLQKPEEIGLGAMDLLSGKKLQGAIMGMNHFPVDLPRLVDFYMRGLLDLDTIIAERIPLEKINEGFEKMKAGHSARSVVVFD